MKVEFIEIKVAEYFGMKGQQNRNIIIPNFRGFNFYIHDCDLFIVTPARWCYEVEIKTSLADLKADLKKKHDHSDDIIKWLYFAIPEELYRDGFAYIPNHAGILVIGKSCRLKREPHLDALRCRKLTEEEYLHLGRIACHRLWSAKRKLLEG